VLVPSCLMTLAPVTYPTGDGLTLAEVEDILSQCGPHVMRVPDKEVARQLTLAASDLKGHVDYVYIGLVENYEPFDISGSAFAFISVIGCSDEATADRARERMAHHLRSEASSRGFVCAKAIVQRMTSPMLNADKLDRFLLERFASAATN
jgi:hypothetical protein